MSARWGRALGCMLIIIETFAAIAHAMDGHLVRMTLHLMILFVTCGAMIFMED